MRRIPVILPHPSPVQPSHDKHPLPAASSLQENPHLFPLASRNQYHDPASYAVKAGT